MTTTARNTLERSATGRSGTAYSSKTVTSVLLAAEQHAGES